MWFWCPNCKGLFKSRTWSWGTNLATCPFCGEKECHWDDKVEYPEPYEIIGGIK